MIQKIRASIIGLVALISIPVMGQDLLARQAPIDRKMKAVDSVALQKIVRSEQVQAMANIYPSWNNQYAHRYDVEIPDSFRIDLRNFCMPTPSRRITSNYGYRASYRRNHKGIDVKVYIGDTIRAAFTGKIRIVRYDAGGYGNYVLIRHQNGLETVYGHLSKQLVEEDQIVKVGDPIGLGGNTGRSSGSHLHFETRFLGVAIDPSLMFDFVNQDVTNDFFVFRKNGDYKESLLAKKDADEEDDSKDNEIAAKQGNEIHFHKVRSGENLSSIADKYNLTVDKLCNLNRITKRSKLRPGQILRYM